MNKSFKRLLLLNIGIIAGSVLCAGVIAFFVTSTIEETTRQIATNRAIVSRRASLFENLANLKREALLAESYSLKIDRLLPRRDDLLRFRQFINHLASVHHVSANFAFQGAPTPPDPVANRPGFFSLSINIDGSYEAIIKFLKNIEIDGTDYLVGIDNFDITHENGQYRLFAQAKLFFR